MERTNQTSQNRFDTDPWVQCWDADNSSTSGLSQGNIYMSDIRVPNKDTAYKTKNGRSHHYLP